MTQPVLSLVGLVVRRGADLLIRDATLDIGPGEVIVIQGANGSGKTTLLEAIAGVIRPAAGRIALTGHEVHGWSADRVARSGLALIHQESHLFTSLTVRENLMLSTFTQRPGVPAEPVDDCLRRYGLERVANTRTGLLSGGEQHLTALARGLRTNPTVALLDEPLAALAPAARRSLIDDIGKRASAGSSFVIVEHRCDEFSPLCDRIYQLRDGRLGDLDVTSRIPA